MQQQKKRDARGIPRDRDAGTAILGAPGVGKSTWLGNPGKTTKDLSHPLYSLIARKPIAEPGDPHQTAKRQPLLCPVELNNLDDEAYPFALNIFDVETYQALERGTARLSGRQLRAVRHLFGESQRPHKAG